MLIIRATVRKNHGKSASRRLRLANKFPAIVYGGTEAPIAIELNHDAILKFQSKKDFYNNTITLVLDDKISTVKVQAIQRHHFKPKLIHIDFIRF